MFLSPDAALAATTSLAAASSTGLGGVDYAIIAAYLLASIAVGVWMAKRSRRSLADFFASGGKLPWYLLGTSMIATSFAADTPLALSGMVRTEGISGNWFWWCGAAMTMAGVFFFARLWRRAKLVTDTEFADIRYSGRSAKGLRGFRALYFSLVYACIVLGWVNLAMVKIVGGLADPKDFAVGWIDRPLEAVLRFTGFVEEAPVLLVGPEGGATERYAIEARRIGRVGPGPEEGVSLVATRLDVAAGEAIAWESPPGATLADAAVWLDAVPGLACEIATLHATGNEPVGRLLPSTLASIEAPVAVDVVGANATKPGIEVPRSGAGLRGDLKPRDLIDEQVLTVKILLILFLATILYSAAGGLWGVVVTDFIQFFVAMAGSFYLAWVAVSHFGGLGPMVDALREAYGAPRADAMLAMLPSFNQPGLEAAIAASPGTLGAPAGTPALTTLIKWLMFALVIWHASGFADGGSYLAQRMIAARSERDAAVGYLWYGFGHFCVRMWPWLLVGVAGAILFPTLAAQQTMKPTMAVYDPEMNYIFAMRQFVGPGLLGLIVASFIAAYMSTVSTHANLAASYLVNDFYKPFIAPKATEKSLIAISTLATIFVAFIGMVATLYMNSVKGAWFLLGSLNAGIGTVYILRWYWHRINAWSEIACFAAAVSGTLLLALVSWGAQHERGLSGPTSASSLQIAYWRVLDASPALRGAAHAASEALTWRWETVGYVEPEDAGDPSASLNPGAMALHEKLVGGALPPGRIPIAKSSSFSLTDYPYNYILLWPFTLLCWLLATFLSPPVERVKLKEFYRRVRPGGPGWRAIAKECPEVDPADSPLNRRNFLSWGLATACIYAALFSVGELIVGRALMGGVLLVVAIGCGVVLWKRLEADTRAAPVDRP
jgi:Na+/proline symporter